MSGLHAIKGGASGEGNPANNEVIIGGVRYVPEDSLKLTEESLITKIVEQVVHSLGNPSQLIGRKGISEEYTVDSVENLCDEKTANEILATLFDRMPSPHPSRLRPFFTHLEQVTGEPLSAYHKERVKRLHNNGDGKFPYRKMDSILLKLDAEYVFKEAKNQGRRLVSAPLASLRSHYLTSIIRLLRR